MSKSKDTPEKVIYLCTGSKCKRYNKEISHVFREALKEHHLKKDVEIIKTECTGRCKMAPVVCLQPQNKWFLEVDEDVSHKIVKKYLLK